MPGLTLRTASRAHAWTDAANTPSVRGVRSSSGCSMLAAPRVCLEMGADGCQLRGALRQRVVQRGEVLFSAGQPFHALYVVQSGSIKSYSLSATGEEQIGGFHLQGDIIGMDAICQREYQSHATALEYTRVCVLRYDRLFTDFPPDSHLQSVLVSAMSRELLSLAKAQTLLSRVSAEQRVTRFLRDIIDRVRQSRGPVDEIQLTMTREEIGNYLGLASETVSRVLVRLRDQRILAIRGRRVRVLRYEEIVRLAG